MKGFIAAVVVLGVFCIMQVTANKMCYDCMDCDEVKADTTMCNTTTSCMVVYKKSGDNSTVDRSCGDAKCTKVGCMEDKDGGKSCCCETDKCNGAGALTSALAMMVAPLVASIYFTRS